MAAKQTIRAVALAAITFLAACGGPPEFDKTAYTDDSARRLFTEAMVHLSDNYIDPIDMRTLSVAGLNGLNELDPNVRAAAGPAGGYMVYANSATPARFDAPRAPDATAWATMLAEAVTLARTQSTTLTESEPEDVYTAVMDGITATLDGFSRYEPPKRATESRARREGYGGIGVTIRDIEGETVIQEVMPETPAARAGLLKDDVITHADGVDFFSLEREDRAELLRGPIGEPVDVSIRRVGVTPFTVSIVRDEIIPTTVYFEEDLGLPRFRISSFSRNTSDALAEAIAEAEQRAGGLDGIVLDLRGNPGGYLTQAVDMADLFLESGVLVETKGRHPSSSSNYRARAGAIAAGKPIILLIDGRSASASELFAAALVDAGRAVAVGSVTYGKGSIQNLERLANGAELIITWSRMHAPSGYLLDGLGVRPTVCTAHGGEAAALLRASRQPSGMAARWRAYKSKDEATAERLRAVCPTAEDQKDVDIAVARMLLEDRNAYKAALSPARDPARHAGIWRRPGRQG